MIYGHNRTIHSNEYLHVEVDEHGMVASVWFRCMALPFKQVFVSRERATEMRKMYKESAPLPKLVAVEIVDENSSS